MKMIIRSAALTLVLFISLIVCSCVALNKPHPNQVSLLDSQSYNTLIGARAAIDSAKADKLPDYIINPSVESYNICRASWIEYRHITESLAPGQVLPDSYRAKLTNDTQNLANAIKALKRRTK